MSVSPFTDHHRALFVYSLLSRGSFYKWSEKTKQKHISSWWWLLCKFYFAWFEISHLTRRKMWRCTLLSLVKCCLWTQSITSSYKNEFVILRFGSCHTCCLSSSNHSFVNLFLLFLTAGFCLVGQLFLFSCYLAWFVNTRPSHTIHHTKSLSH